MLKADPLFALLTTLKNIFFNNGALDMYKYAKSCVKMSAIE